MLMKCPWLFSDAAALLCLLIRLLMNGKISTAHNKTQKKAILIRFAITTEKKEANVTVFFSFFLKVIDLPGGI